MGRHSIDPKTFIRTIIEPVKEAVKEYEADFKMGVIPPYKIGTVEAYLEHNLESLKYIQAGRLNALTNDFESLEDMPEGKIQIEIEINNLIVRIENLLKVIREGK